MIKKLKRKFILVTMSFVTLILLIVFSVLGYSSYHRMNKETMDSLQHTLQSGTTSQLPNFEFGDRKEKGPGSMNQTSFAVITDQDKQITSILSKNVSVDQTTLQNLLPSVFQDSDQTGTISSQNLAYQYEKTSTGYKIAFVDISSQHEELMSLLLNSLLLGTGAMLAFLVMSILLSNWALKPVEKTWNQQKQFVADASHELKTPLTVILADSDILLSKPQDSIQSQKKWIESIHIEADRMKKLVENLLFLAKSDADQNKLILERVNLSDIAWSCLLPFESIAYEKGVHLHSEIDSDLFISGAETQLKQLLLIFLENACKYTCEKGKVSFLLKKTGDKALITIHNTGSFIPKEEITHIFERFYRCDKARLHQGGYGLGLSIAKSIMDQHHASIQVSSDQVSGTTFKLQFHLA